MNLMNLIKGWPWRNGHAYLYAGLNTADNMEYKYFYGKEAECLKGLSLMSFSFLINLHSFYVIIIVVEFVK